MTVAREHWVVHRRTSLWLEWNFFFFFGEEVCGEGIVKQRVVVAKDFRGVGKAALSQIIVWKQVVACGGCRFFV